LFKPGATWAQAQSAHTELMNVMDTKLDMDHSDLSIGWVRSGRVEMSDARTDDIKL